MVTIVTTDTLDKNIFFLVTVLFLYLFFSTFLRVVTVTFPSKARTDVDGNCTVPGALYVPKVSQDHHRYAMPSACRDGGRARSFTVAVARLSRHALMRHRAIRRAAAFTKF